MTTTASEGWRGLRADSGDVLETALLAAACTGKVTVDRSAIAVFAERRATVIDGERGCACEILFQVANRLLYQGGLSRMVVISPAGWAGKAVELPPSVAEHPHVQRMWAELEDKARAGLWQKAQAVGWLLNPFGEDKAAFRAFRRCGIVR